MNKLQKITGQIFTKEFIIFLQSIPVEVNDDRRVRKLVKKLTEQLNGKPVVDCLLSLTYYLSCLMLDEDDTFEDTINAIKEINGEYNIENYIQ